jgi:hypothetical protein
MPSAVPEDQGEWKPSTDDGGIFPRLHTCQSAESKEQRKLTKYLKTLNTAFIYRFPAAC